MERIINYRKREQLMEAVEINKQYYGKTRELVLHKEQWNSDNLYKFAVNNKYYVGLEEPKYKYIHSFTVRHLINVGLVSIKDNYCRVPFKYFSDEEDIKMTTTTSEFNDLRITDTSHQELIDKLLITILPSYIDKYGTNDFDKLVKEIIYIVNETRL